MSDTPPGEAVCYGPSGWQVCLGAAPSGQVQLEGTINTSTSTQCLNTPPSSWTATQPDACIIIGGTVTVGTVSVTGPRPLVIVAQSRITVTSLLDVASHSSTGTVGAGSAPTDCKPFGRDPGNGQPNGGGGGGAGGSFMFPGADGGTGDAVNHQGGQAAVADVGPPTRLRGGCSGQGGAGKSNDGGAGGGAVYLVSAGLISIQGKINASGGGGGGGDVQDGGGGGGSGGMIVLYGLPVMTTSATLLIANGGGGGGGGANGGTTAKGSDGHDPGVAVPIMAASGGGGGILIGFTGGDGGSGYATSSSAVVGLNGDTGAGGGGGGGGGGYIQSNQGLGVAVVSPAVTIKP